MRELAKFTMWSSVRAMRHGQNGRLFENITLCSTKTLQYRLLHSVYGAPLSRGKANSGAIVDIFYKSITGFDF